MYDHGAAFIRSGEAAAPLAPPAAAAPSSPEPVHARFGRLRERYLDDITGLMADCVRETTPAGSSLVTMADYHLATGGKRLRALLPLMVAEALGADPARLVPFGAACEMLHNATLVHDDTQDGDGVRRGRPTVWARFGKAQAVNLGDAMFYYTLLLVQRLDAPPALREAAADLTLRQTLRVIDGQEREFALLAAARPTLDDYFAMVEGKTSGLFSLPMAGAALLAGAPQEVVAGLDRAARHLGALFQMQDDVLDLYGDKGRDIRGSDIAEGKRSALAVHALNHARPADARRLLAILDLPREDTGPGEIDEALAIFDRAGSLAFTLGEMEVRRERAVRLAGLDGHPPLVALIDGLTDLVLEPIRGVRARPRPAAPLSTALEADRAVARRALPEVSRTFALSIEALPSDLADAVRVAYLLCRIVDTVEDEPHLPPETREALFDAFDAALADDNLDPHRFEAAHAAALGPRRGADHDLCRNAGAVFRLFRALPAVQREAIRPHVQEMSRGMRAYGRRAAAAGGRLRLRDLPDLERYCYFVAGTVGHLLTSLFEASAGPVEGQKARALRERAVSFGLGLQLVNILKDVAGDLERGDCFLPEREARAAGVDLDRLLDPSQREAGLTLIRTLAGRARHHLARAEAYTLLWPARRGAAVRLFCAVPLALALATLREVERGEDALRRERAPKVSRALVARLMLEARAAAADDDALRALFDRYR